jgi:SOS-response transcriptional repressor LexA
MEELGITLGDPIIVDVSPEAIKNLTNGQLVVVEIPGKRGEETTLLLRQYISPNLLITNSITENSTPIHRVAAKAVIIGIVMQ